MVIPIASLPWAATSTLTICYSPGTQAFTLGYSNLRMRIMRREEWFLKKRKRESGCIFTASDDILISALVEAGTDCTGCGFQSNFARSKLGLKLGFSSSWFCTRFHGVVICQRGWGCRNRHGNGLWNGLGNVQNRLRNRLRNGLRLSLMLNMLYPISKPSRIRFLHIIWLLCARMARFYPSELSTRNCSRSNRLWTIVLQVTETFLEKYDSVEKNSHHSRAYSTNLRQIFSTKPQSDEEEIIFESR